MNPLLTTKQETFRAGTDKLEFFRERLPKMNSRVPSMKQMVVQKRHTFAAGLKNERESRRIIFLR